MEANKSRSGLFRSMLIITTIPIFIFAVVIVLFSSERFSDAMQQEVKNGLRSMGTTVIMIYDTLYPGDYVLLEEETKDGISVTVMKGEHQLNGDYTIIDKLKAETGLDFTIFYTDTRIITTIINRAGERIIATGANAVVLEDVLYDNAEHFYPEVEINDQSYFAYYAPLRNADGTCVGMMFVGKPTAQVNQSVKNCLIPIIIIAAVGMIITGAFSTVYSKRLIASIKKLEGFLGKVEKGNLTTELEPDVLGRSDEVGEMGRYVVNMQKALRELIEQDALTQMNNRRYGEKKLKQIQRKSKSSGLPFTVAIGDIDFFKKVNDTYGHECGDLVLKNVSLLLKKHIAGNGFVARWGGEEFLIVYEKDDMETARAKLEPLLDELRVAKIQYGDDIIGVTMTFGMTDGDVDDLDKILREADECLYAGKANGRNQVVTIAEMKSE